MSNELVWVTDNKGILSAYTSHESALLVRLNEADRHLLVAMQATAYDGVTSVINALVHCRKKTVFFMGKGDYQLSFPIEMTPIEIASIIEAVIESEGLSDDYLEWITYDELVHTRRYDFLSVSYVDHLFAGGIAVPIFWAEISDISLVGNYSIKDAYIDNLLILNEVARVMVNNPKVSVDKDYVDSVNEVIFNIPVVFNRAASVLENELGNNYLGISVISSYLAFSIEKGITCSLSKQFDDYLYGTWGIFNITMEGSPIIPSEPNKMVASSVYAGKSSLSSLLGKAKQGGL